MEDILDFIADALEGWNSKSRADRWLARGCGCVIFGIIAVLSLIAIYWLSQPR
jgi:hypothetical protein